MTVIAVRVTPKLSVPARNCYEHRIRGNRTPTPPNGRSPPQHRCARTHGCIACRRRRVGRRRRRVMLHGGASTRFSTVCSCSHARARAPAARHRHRAAGTGRHSTPTLIAARAPALRGIDQRRFTCHHRVNSCSASQQRLLEQMPRGVVTPSCQRVRRRRQLAAPPPRARCVRHTGTRAPTRVMGTVLRRAVGVFAHYCRAVPTFSVLSPRLVTRVTQSCQRVRRRFLRSPR